MVLDTCYVLLFFVIDPGGKLICGGIPLVLILPDLLISYIDLPTLNLSYLIIMTIFM